MGITEQTILEQFPFWRAALAPKEPLPEVPVTVFVGCGTSYNLSLSLAASANAHGRAAVAVPAREWVDRPQSYWPNWRQAHVVALSRSGETTETIAAAEASRSAGARVTGITCAAGSGLAAQSDRVVFAETHPAEGIVMTSSASLMLLLGLQLIGIPVDERVVSAAEAALTATDRAATALIAGRSHFVYLGGGPLFGIALEGALKLLEMSQTFAQAFHPLEYRHGPISLLDERTVGVMLYGDARPEDEALLVGEMQAKGARVIGFGGPGDVAIDVAVAPVVAGLAVLPALQLLGERVAEARGLDTVAPRHLTKVVTLA
ncbi:SIS domain-containing protein [Mesorhizobium sp. BR1-1-16]|uniref:SIS domain-containing protein n=1 Tax=Mesorhizobium sp. BR1-1-16 TaxID=2876653 RepID=UPI001CCAB731|nr:SIS domain-containing protein [Mesorhizobium sp. BR1-1-16]MBZ9937974.1 SIS domain-containing protein [Mesorhizobium sp. BR1-1-16]